MVNWKALAECKPPPGHVSKKNWDFCIQNIIQIFLQNAVTSSFGQVFYPNGKFQEDTLIAI